MNIEFKYENPVNQFTVRGPMTEHDLKVLRIALFRFFESHPKFVIVDLIHTEPVNTTIQDHLVQLENELTTLASSQAMHFQILKDPQEINIVGQTLLEEALRQRELLLASKNKLKEELGGTAKSLLEENEKLKERLHRIHEANPQSKGSLSTLLDHFWSAK